MQPKTIKQQQTLNCPMKHPGNISDFIPMRNRELMEALRKCMENTDFFDINKDFEQVVNSPCSRYWISEERAMLVVSAMMKNQPTLQNMRPTKREMFMEIFCRVYIMKVEHPEMTLNDCVYEVVNSPSRKFFMKPRHAREIIYNIKKSKKHKLTANKTTH